MNIGTIVLNKPAGVAAVPAGLRIGSNGGAFEHRDRAAGQRSADRGPGRAPCSGLLDLNGHFDSIGALTFRCGHIATGVGELTLEADVEVFGGRRSSAGRLALGGPPRVFTTHTDVHFAERALAVCDHRRGRRRWWPHQATASACSHPRREQLRRGDARGGRRRCGCSIRKRSASRPPDAGHGACCPDGSARARREHRLRAAPARERQHHGSTAFQCSARARKHGVGPIHLTGSTGLFTPDACSTCASVAISGAGELLGHRQRRRTRRGRQQLRWRHARARR